MCGLAGSISGNSQVDVSVLQGIRHRGPDEQTYLNDSGVILYHTRLAIQDVCEGHQPMSLNDELSIAFNGEIYNHLELREKHKLTCTTRSDTETMLQLYKKLGISFLDELDGMFAIALHDKTNRQLWLIRDRAGKKPLYYYHKNEEWFFASELNVINRVKKPSIKAEYFYEFLRMGIFYRSHTPYQNVEELPAGYLLKIDLSSNRSELRNWWNIKPFYLQENQIDENTALNRADDILRKAVKQRILSSDLEVGCFLSGGIDSSLIASIASSYNRNLKTFTVAFPGAYNEAPLARLVADKIGSEHTEINIDFTDLRENVEKILANYGEPFTDSSAIPTWYVSREAKHFVTVILNGDGADELFGGYRRYVPFSKYDFFQTSYPFRRLAGFLNSCLPVSNEKKSLYNYFYRLISLAKKRSVDVYCAAGVDIFEGYLDEAFIDSKNVCLNEVEADFRQRLEGVETGLKKLMLLDFDVNLFGALLVKMDIGSMAHALEGRSPFLCRDFLEWTPGLPASLKIIGRSTKYLLRELSKKYIPADLVNQPKRGFEIPLKSWVNNDLNEVIYSYLFNANSYNKQFINPTFLAKLWQRKLNIGEEKRAKILWVLFSLEVWYLKSYLV